MSPNMQAVNPPPDGGYSGDNTAEGQNALLSLTTGKANTAIGAQTLYMNVSGAVRARTGVLPLQKGDRPSRYIAVGPCGRSCGKSEP